MPTDLKALVASSDFQGLDENAQFKSLSNSSPMFAELARRDPDRARETARAIVHAGRGDPSVLESFQGGLTKGWGLAAATLSGGISAAEDTGLFDTDLDDSLIAYGKQKIVDGDRRIGTDTAGQIAGAVGQLGGAALPGLVGTALLYAGGSAAGLGAVGMGIPLAIAAEGAGFGLAEFLQAEALDDPNATEVGQSGVALGAAGGATAFLPRRYRMPLDFAAGTAAGLYRGEDLGDALVTGGSLALIAGIPGRRPPVSALADAGIQPDSFPGAARAIDDAGREEAIRSAVKAQLDQPMATPIEGPDGTVFKTATEVLEAMGDEYQMKGVHRWNPLDWTPEQVAAFQQAAEDSLGDGRGIGVREQKPGTWSPGWNYQPKRAHGANPAQITAKTGAETTGPGEIIANLAEPFGFTVARGSTKGAGSGTTLGWHHGLTQEMRVLHYDDVQTVAHEFGHQLVTTDPGLKRWVRGAEFEADKARLRSFLLDKEITAGRGTDPAFSSDELPVKALRRHEAEIPDDLKYIPELSSASYDRADVEEGLSEFLRVYLTNNAESGGQVQVRQQFPALHGIVDDWAENLERPQRRALKDFQRDATEYAGLDAAASAIARMGDDVSTESLLQGTMSKFRQAVVDKNEGVWNAVSRSMGPEEADRVVAYFQSADSSTRLMNLAVNRAMPGLEFDIDGHLKQAITGGESLESIMKDAVGDLPVKEGFNAQGVYSMARRQRELFDQAHTPQGVKLVDDVISRVMKKLNADAAAGRNVDPQANALRKKFNSRSLSVDEEDAILRVAGAQRREKTPLAEIEENLRLVENPRYAHMKDTHKRLVAWQRGIREYGRKSGLYGDDQIRLWDKWNSEYVFPFYRAEATGGGPVQTLHGSEKPLRDDWMTLTMQGAQETFGLAERNLAKKEFVQSVLNSEKSGAFFDILPQIARSRRTLGPHALYQVVGDVPKPSDGKVVTFREHGKPLHYVLKDDGAYQSIKFFDREDQGKFVQYGNAVRVAMQDAITLNPEFFVPALFRDVTGGFLFSKTKGNIFGKAAKGFWSAIRNDTDYQKYLANVGTHAQLTDVAKTSPKALRQSVQRATNGYAHDIIRGPKSVVDVLRRITNAIEASVRVGEYKSAVAQGVPEKHAAWLGTQIQPNFSAHGTSELLRGLTKLTPFLNATIQSVDRFGRGLVRDPQGRSTIATRLAGMAMAGVTLNEINRRLDPQYDERPDWLKRAYFIVPVPLFDENGFQTDEAGNLKIERALIAKNHELGLIENVAEYAMDALHNSEDPDVVQGATDVASMLLSGIGVNAGGDSFPLPLPIGVGLGVELYSNKDLFTGNPIVPLEQASLMAHAQASHRTPDIWRKYGEFAHDMPVIPEWLKSPMVAQHIWRYFTAQTGAQAEMLTEVLLNPDRAGTRFRDGPVMRRLNLRDSKYSNVPTDFFETATELRQLADTIQFYQKNGDIEKLQEMLSDRESVQRYSASKAFEQARRQVSRISDVQDVVRRRKDMTPMAKTLEVEKLEAMKREVERVVLENWGDLR